MSQTVDGIVVYRRAVSKKLVFYDFELANAAQTIELVLKVGALDIETVKLLRDTIRLGDTLRVTGEWQQPLQKGAPQFQEKQGDSHEPPLQPQARRQQPVQQEQRQHGRSHQEHQQQQQQQQWPQNPEQEPQDPHPANHHREFLAASIQILRRWQDDHPHQQFIPRPSTAPRAAPRQLQPKQPPTSAPPKPTTLPQPLPAPSDQLPADAASSHMRPAPTTPSSSSTLHQPASLSTISQPCTEPSSTHSEAADPLLGAQPQPAPAATTTQEPTDHNSTIPEAADPLPGTRLQPAPAATTSQATTEPSSSYREAADPLLGTCKFWVNTRSCSRGAFCPYAHPAGPDRHSLRRQWERSRGEERMRRARAEGLHRDESAASKAARARVFTEWLVEKTGVEALSMGSGVLDVAGGRGSVSFELATRYNIPTLLVEPRPAKLTKAQRRRLLAEPAASPLRAPDGALSLAGPAAPTASSPDLQAGQEGAIPAACAAAAAAAQPVCTAPGAPAAAAAPAPATQPDSIEDVFHGSFQGSFHPDIFQHEDADEATHAAGEGAGGPGWQLPQLQELFGPDLWRQGPHAERMRACSMVVGMHPDEATEAILEFALECNKPFAIVPCCVFPRQFPHRRLKVEGGGEEAVESYQQLVTYLAQRGGARVAHLGFQGANCVVFRLPDA